MRPTKLLSAILLVVLGFSTTWPIVAISAPKERLALHGKVFLLKGERKIPLPDIAIGLRKDKQIRKSSTDSEGEYAFYGRLEGEYELLARFSNKTYVQKVKLKPTGDPESKDIIIKL